MVRQTSEDSRLITGAEDHGFTFPLPTQVQGLNARGKEFSEDTVLTYISHQWSSFYLKNPVHIGLRLRIAVDLPEKLSDDRTLKLIIKGEVAKVELLPETGSGQRVTIKFDNKYIIKSNA